MKKEKNKTSLRVTRILFGILEIVIAVIAFINVGFISKFLTFVLAYLFGAIYFLVSIFLFLDGLNRIFIRKKIKIISLTGVILLFLGLTIGLSQSDGLNMSNFFSFYNDLVSSIKSSNFAFTSFGDIVSSLNGGFIGYFFSAALTTAFSSIGSLIVSALLIFLGAVFVLLLPISQLISHLVSVKNEVKTIREKEKELKKTETDYSSPSIESPLKREIHVEKIEEEMEAYVPTKKIAQPSEKLVENIKEPIVLDVNLVKEEIKPNSFSFSDPSHEEAMKKIEEKKTNKREPRIVDTYKNDKFDSFFNKKSEKETIETITPEEEYNGPYVYPSLDLLKDRVVNNNLQEKIAIADERAKKINECFRDFDIGASVISYTIGPSVTRFDVKLNHNVKTSVLNNLETDLGVRLEGNKTVRIETIIEGRDTCGIEVGNKTSDLVSFKDCMQSIADNTKDKLLFPLGKDISGKVISCKLDDMPHLLIAGTTGSGKSVFIHNIITSLIMRNKPDELKLMLIDPKRVEFLRYQNLPHLLCPVITSTDQGKIALKKLVEEMESRYDLFAEKGEGAANYKEYLEVCEEKNYPKIPYIVMICDEFADFMSDGDKETSKFIQRLAQKARACGIYMVIATQRPSAKIITGEIKANIPSRIALSVSSSLESRIIIDEDGAENLMGKGDLLARLPSPKSLLRVQSAYIDGKEIYAVCEHIKKYAVVHYDPKFDLSSKAPTAYDLINESVKDFHDDELYPAVKNYVLETGKCTPTKIQNAFKIGFARADGLLDALEEDGIIIKENGRRALSDEYLNEDNQSED